ncbi:hypothetical protein [Haloglycomyces albus]|uniref:hypothetical protein n=1 Tax=Haloglycomyces albus TaxID=526067 RepID=UPI00046D3FE1|nr:hypothetical protein [Haloglycomyces albus]
MTIKANVDKLLRNSTETSVPVRYEGSNICTWIGFKHVNYVIEEAVLEHFRSNGLGARELYERFGLGLDLTNLDTRIFSALHTDDAATAVVIPSGDDDRLSFTVKLSVMRDGKATKAATAQVDVHLRRGTYGFDTENDDGLLEPFAVESIADSATTLDLPDLDLNGDIVQQATAGRNAFAWKWRIPYMYCHYNERVQMSGFLRQMEEAEDLFLADRGISIKTMLDDRRWIPVVPHSRIRLLNEAIMEEQLYTVYTIEQVFKTLTYTARMDCFVIRDNTIVPVATGSITHGYAVIDDRSNWTLVDFDERVMTALTRGEKQ